ncbi:hypothetical protein [Rummeliibacillus pycnus]|uniref:hypothetical protein n=1 Tax=Rummeliibacillus pycnus TaxID=101070 RepID=UPI003D2AC478
MKKVLLCALLLLITTACSHDEKKVEPVEVEKATPTIEDRDKYLKSNKFIEEFHNSEDEDGFNHLTVKMRKEFTQKSISKQYLYLIDLYKDYNSKFHEVDYINSLEVYFDDTEFPAYKVYLATFVFVGANVSIDRENWQIPSDRILQLLDTLDKKDVLSGKEAGLTLAEVENDEKPLIKESLITSSEEVTGALQSSNVAKNTKSTTSDPDSETDIEGMTGFEWIKLSDNQKFHAVSNALYSLDNKGYTVLESEDFYIDALNSFYTDSTTMNESVSGVLSTVGKMSGTIRK